MVLGATKTRTASSHQSNQKPRHECLARLGVRASLSFAPTLSVGAERPANPLEY
jgi:hypothetical protein